MLEFDNAYDIGDLASAVTAAVALFGVGFAAWQTRQIRRHQLEALARDQYLWNSELIIPTWVLRGSAPTKIRKKRLINTISIWRRA